MANSLTLNGHDLTLTDIEDVAYAGRKVGLADSARREVERSRAFVERLLETGDPIYGVTTGFGRLADVYVSPEEQVELQRNLVRSHSAGVGTRLDAPAVRTIMLLRANALARGHSGCRPVIIERLLDFLNHGVHPMVPSVGSVGASGDLAPLAHVALCLMGEGEVTLEGVSRPTPEVLKELGIEPIELREKEGLSLINGTQATTGLGVLAYMRAMRALDALDIAGVLSLEGLMGTPEPFRSELHEARPHAGQLESAERLRALTEGSEIRESHRFDDPRVQDAYSLRCMPQVHGAARQAMTYVAQVLETEANSTTDNPLVLPDAEVVVSGGNFHAQVVSAALDFMVIAITDVAAISERRLERLLNPDLSGLPAFLTPKPGLRSGFMIAQVTAVDLLGEMRILSHPASVDSVSTSASQEDHVSMGLTAARKASRAVECFETVVAIELMAGAQAVEFRRPLKASPPIEAAHALIRERVEPLDEDRPFTADIEAVLDVVRSGDLSRIT